MDPLPTPLDTHTLSLAGPDAVFSGPSSRPYAAVVRSSTADLLFVARGAVLQTHRDSPPFSPCTALSVYDACFVFAVNPTHIYLQNCPMEKIQ